jgi:hypothetical protein
MKLRPFTGRFWIERHRLADGHLHSRLLLFAESGQLGGDSVGADRQDRGAEEPLVVGDHRAGCAGVAMGDGDGHSGHDGSRRIDDGPFDGTAGALRVSRQRRRE